MYACVCCVLPFVVHMKQFFFVGNVSSTHCIRLIVKYRQNEQNIGWKGVVVVIWRFVGVGEGGVDCWWYSWWCHHSESIYACNWLCRCRINRIMTNAHDEEKKIQCIAIYFGFLLDFFVVTVDISLLTPSEAKTERQITMEQMIIIIASTMPNERQKVKKTKKKKAHTLTHPHFHLTIYIQIH